MATKKKVKYPNKEEVLAVVNKRKDYLNEAQTKIIDVLNDMLKHNEMHCTDTLNVLRISTMNIEENIRQKNIEENIRQNFGGTLDIEGIMGIIAKIDDSKNKKD